ncbi:MAG: PLP-dependent aminotransferase family protein [Dehalococcoidia bacterium]
MDLALNLSGSGPRGRMLVGALREAILSGRLVSGTRLPSSRLLAAQLRIARGTVVAAYEELVSEGYCEARVGAGTFVAITPPPRQMARPVRPVRLSAWAQRLPVQEPVDDQEPLIRFDFRSGLSEEGFPDTALARALRRAAEQITSGVGAGDPAGSLRLRRALVHHLGRTRGLRADPEQVIVVSGSQQGIDLASRLLMDPGDRACIEEPGYPRARAVFTALGARLSAVPVDRDGLIVDALPSEDIRMLYVTPSHQYPTGAVLTPERRLALLDWAERNDVWLLEDDYDSEFRYAGPPLPCLQGLDRAGRCLYVGSVSKLLHPALRTGCIIVPPALVPAAVEAKRTLDQATTPLMQEALADMFESGEIERHLRRALRFYRRRRAHLLAALAGGLGPGVRIWPVTGGLHLYVEAPDLPGRVVFAEARRRGVAVTDASDCLLSDSSGTRLILWFSRIPLDRLAAGIEALRDALDAARGSAEPAGFPDRQPLPKRRTVHA